MVESTNNTPPDPPQMRNGGSPPAHLSSSSLSDPSWWLQFKWSQPPPRAPEWLFDYYEHYNPPPGPLWSTASLERMALTRHPRRPRGCRVTPDEATRGANSSWGSRARGLRIQGLKVGRRRTVGRRAPSPLSRRGTGRLRSPGGGSPPQTAPQ